MHTHTHYLKKKKSLNRCPLRVGTVPRTGLEEADSIETPVPRQRAHRNLGMSVSMPAIPTLGRLSLQAGEFKVSLGYLNETLSQKAGSAQFYLQREFSQEIRKAAGKSSQDLRSLAPVSGLQSPTSFS